MSLPTLEERVIAYYDRATPGYYLEGWDPEHIHFGIFDPLRNSNYETSLASIVADKGSAVAAMTEAILAMGDFRGGERVVDAGCGVGGTSLLLAKRGCRVTGVNIVESQLALARSRAAEAGLSSAADFVWGNCSVKLPFDDASVDAVVNIESACHYGDRAQFLLEVSRILKPGGRLVAQDWIEKDEVDPEERLRLDALADAWHMPPPLESLSSYRRLLEAAGLEVTFTSRLGDEARANGLIFRHGWLQTRQWPDILLNDEQRERREQSRTFADTFLDGLLGLGFYTAKKTALA